MIDTKGQPAVTDLGLAKRIDDESELTKSGLVMGTPGFMAPEQAAGKKDITTAADVFSLGAMLFWLTTGNVPFRGDNAVQIAMQTIKAEIPSVRSFNPKADSDLDLICRKAMHKNPLQRYSSAAALADDLQAWLDGEPLSVRPPSAINLAAIWVRKNLRTALAACISGVLFGFLVGIVLQLDMLRWIAEQEFRIQQLGGSARTWVDPLMGLRVLSDTWDLTQFLVVPGVAVSAFACVLIVRPKSRQTNIAVGLTAGLVATVVAFLCGVGWIVIQGRSLELATQDIHLLSTAMWLETESERELAQRALIQRYPGLESMDRSVRQKRTEEKIIHDQRTGLVPGLWLAVLASFMVAGLPLAGTCILSGMIWQRGYRSWHWFAYTWEHGAYFLVFVFILSLWIQDIAPWLGYMLAALAAVGFCLYVAVCDVKLIWRLFLIPIPFLAMGTLNMDMNNMRNAPRNAGRATTHEEYEKQLKLCDRLLDNTEISFVRYQAAVGWLYLGDHEKYQLHCKKELDKFENAYTPGVASRLTKMSLLRPEFHADGTIPLLNDLSEYASSFESADNIRWYYSTRALVEVRRNESESALMWNQRCRKGEVGNSNNGYRHSFSHAVDALAHIAMGNTDQARESISLGRELAERSRAAKLEDGIDSSWVDWLIFQIVEHEVNRRLAAIESSVPE